jgi:predicted MFS family arabinose efflux permease
MIWRPGPRDRMAENPSEINAASQSGTSAESAGERVYTRDFWLVFIATSALNTAANLLVLFPVFVVNLGGGASTIGILAATAGCGALVMRPAASAAIERRGRRWTAMWFLALLAIGNCLYLPIASLGWPLYAAVAFNGVVNGAVRVALFTMVYPLLPPARAGEAMAIFSLSGQGPASFGALLGELIVHFFGFTGLFLSAAAITLAAAALVAMVARDDPAADSGPNVEVAPDGAAGTPVAGYGELLTDRALAPLWIATVAFSLAISARPNFIAPFAYARGIRSVGVYFTVYGLVAVCVRLNARRFDQIGLERLLGPALAILGVGIGAIAATGHFAMIELAAAIGGIGHGAAYPALSALVIRSTPPRASGRASTIYTSIADFCAIAGPFGLGMLARAAGYPAMFAVAGAIGVAGAIVFAAGGGGR